MGKLLRPITSAIIAAYCVLLPQPAAPCSRSSPALPCLRAALIPRQREHRPSPLGTALAVRGGAKDPSSPGKGGATMAKSKGTSLGRLRDAVFPIYGGRETGKFLALGGIQFFIIFVLTLTRDLKDTLIITSCGAEAISFLKVSGGLCFGRGSD